MIHSICVDSCIHEDLGDLLMAVQCCIMKAAHPLLRSTTEEISISQAFFSEVLTKISLLPSCESHVSILTNS